MNSGLVSVTFRQLAPEKIVDLARRAGLDGIEWGGDVHVPPGDEALALRVARMTRDAGLAVSSYGSYYRCDGDRFHECLTTALALEAKVIRVWAGRIASAGCTSAMRARITADAAKCAQMCHDNGVTLAFEYHGGTLTDTPASAERLLGEVPFAKTYWQPNVGYEEKQLKQSLRGVAEQAVRLHVFHWNGQERRPLAEGEAKWRPLLPLARAAEWALLEFVKDESEEQFLADAQTLKGWLARL